MSADVRQGIHFDLDTAALQRYYPKGAWRSAYDDVRTFLIHNGFEHEQGSGYHSIRPMTQVEAVNILDEMLVTYPWLHKCVRVCTVADVPKTFDFSNMLDKNADVPMRDDLFKQSLLKKIKAQKSRPKQKKSRSGPER